MGQTPFRIPPQFRRPVISPRRAIKSVASPHTRGTRALGHCHAAGYVHSMHVVLGETAVVDLLTARALRNV